MIIDRSAYCLLLVLAGSDCFHLANNFLDWGSDKGLLWMLISLLIGVILLGVGVVMNASAAAIFARYVWDGFRGEK